jgi:hypothetical protein
VQLPLNQIIPGIKEGSTSKGILMHSKSYKLDQNTVENITKLKGGGTGAARHKAKSGKIGIKRGGKF